MSMDSEYVERRDGAHFVAGTRVSLDIDRYLEEGENELDERTSIPLSETNPQLWAKLERARQETAGST